MSNTRSFTVVRNRLILLFIVAIGLVVCLLFYLNYKQAEYIAHSEDIGAIINKSGRQRMLSQWLTKEVLIEQLSPEQSVSEAELDSVLLLFEDSHELLFSKSKQLDKSNLNDLFQQIQPVFISLVSLVENLEQDEDVSIDSVGLLELESAFLPLMDAITYEFELVQTDTFDAINDSVSFSNRILALVIFIIGTTVLIITVNIIKGYSSKLQDVRLELQNSLAGEQSKLDKLHFLTDTIKVGVWEKDFRESTEKWTARLYEILGYDKTDFKGTAAEFMSLVHPSDLQTLKNASNRSIMLGEPSTVELRVRNASGDYIWVEASGNARKNAKGELDLLIGGVSEITDRKLLEVQLRVFIERAPAAIAMFDTDMKYIAASHKWKVDYGILDQEIIGRSHYDVFPEIGDDWKAIHQKCMQGHVDINEEDPFEREDGSLQYIKWEVRPWYKAEDQVGGLLMFTQDVTQTIKEKEELRKAKIMAEDAARSKEEFLATMSHEIRTPLNAIIGISHILQMEDHKPEQAEQIRLLRFSGENLLSLINDILDISKINSGKIKLSLGRFDLKYLIENIKNSLAFKAKENMVKLSVVYDSKLADYFIGDVTRIAQIMNNLVGNAIKFTKNGEVVIGVELIAEKEDASQIRISVKDNGIGIDPVNQQKIFNSFEQAEEGTTRRFGGTGLGLFITKKLIELMGSSIQVESEPGKGSLFYFELNLPHVEDDQPEPKTELKHSSLESLNLNLLVAEDNTANQMIVMKYLNTIKASYDIVSDGQKALEMIKSKAYDMVFMDLQMPVMDGYESTRAIRKLPDDYFQSVPIIALTADAFADIKGQTQTIGMSDFLSKPFKPSVLYDVIKRNVGQVSPEKKELKIEQVISELAGTDEDFRVVFTNQCLESYLEFYQALNLLLVQPELDNLKKSAHKIKSLNVQFELNDLQTSLSELISIGEGYENEKTLSTRVLALTKEAIDELKKMSIQSSVQ